MREKIVKLYFDSHLGIVYALGSKTAALFKPRQLLGVISMSEKVESVWNIEFNWIKWELDDLDDAIKILEDVNDINYSASQKEQMKIEYFDKFFTHEKDKMLINQQLNEDLIAQTHNAAAKNSTNANKNTPRIKLTLPASMNSRENKRLFVLHQDQVQHELNF